MRIQKVLIAMLLLLAGGMAMHAQNARVSISDSSLSLGELINQIEKQTDYLFVMGGDIDKSIVLPVSVRNASVETVLNSALPGAGLDFRFSNNYITLIRQTLHQGPVQSEQVGFISGTVIDESGLPVIGAAVIQQGSATNGTVTDENGLFQIRVPAGTGLEVSCIGYTTRTATATPGMNIVLDEDSELLAGTVSSPMVLSSGPTSPVPSPHTTWRTAPCQTCRTPMPPKCSAALPRACPSRSLA